VPSVVNPQRRHYGVPVAAAAILKQGGLPVDLPTQDRIDYGGVSYWATQMRAVPR
jgi:hypothetical protein